MIKLAYQEIMLKYAVVLKASIIGSNVHKENTHD